MNISNVAVKKTALFSLKNKYTSGIIAACIYLTSLFILSACAATAAVAIGTAGAYALSILLVVFLLLPLTFGYIYRGTMLIFSGECEPLLVFKYFSSKKEYLKSIKMSFSLVGNALFSYILLSIPAIFTSLLADGTLFSVLGAQIPIWASNLLPVARILDYAAIIITAYIMLKYYMAPFLMAADESMDPLEAIHTSKIIATRSKWDFIRLSLSFIGYILACLLVVPVIFIFPYFNAAYNVHCRFAVAHYNKAIDEANRPKVPNFNANITF